jgi:pimeloyl-ACP methyl ester carboxylesterase
MLTGRGVALGSHEQHVVTLRDGRRLGYAEYGERRGVAALYFHGTPGSRIEGRFLDDAARRAGVRLIAVDRPGFGLSDYVRGRRFLHWPADVGELADALGLERFALVALSGGGPHAAACALRMPERLTAVVVAGGAAPIEAVVRSRGSRLGRAWARAGAWIIRVSAPLFCAQIAFVVRRVPARWFGRGIDRRVLASETAREGWRKDFVEAFRHGSRGAALEFGLHTRGWGFAPGEVRAAVRLWHGERDRVVPAAAARAYAAELRACRATFVPAGEHLVLFEHADEVLGELRSQ